MKRHREESINEQPVQDPPVPCDGKLQQLRGSIQKAVKANDHDALAKQILALSGNRLIDHTLTIDDAEVWMEASVHVMKEANEGVLRDIAVHDQKFCDTSFLFGDLYLPLGCVIKIVDFLNVESKLQLAALNKCWQHVCDSYYFWESLDPLPTKSFSNHNSLKNYLVKNKQKFLGCRSLQMPRIPTSAKLFQDIFNAMPLLNSISLQNVIGLASMRHCMLDCPNPLNMIQLSIGLSTRLSPTEISYALKCFGKIRL